MRCLASQCSKQDVSDRRRFELCAAFTVQMVNLDLILHIDFSHHFPSEFILHFTVTLRPSFILCPWKPPRSLPVMTSPRGEVMQGVCKV